MSGQSPSCGEAQKFKRIARRIFGGVFENLLTPTQKSLRDFDLPHPAPLRDRGGRLSFFGKAS